ncbi:hypothetical protein LEMLEM_LOCUS2861, partial [Lemmus lemmus]
VQDNVQDPGIKTACHYLSSMTPDSCGWRALYSGPYTKRYPGKSTTKSDSSSSTQLGLEGMYPRIYTSINVLKLLAQDHLMWAHQS